MVTADKPLANNNMTRYTVFDIDVVVDMTTYTFVEVVDANIAINDSFLMFLLMTSKHS